MAVQRYISTSFWDDEWIRSLNYKEKFLYMYLMTNTLTNIAGVYKIANHRITYDTGFSDVEIEEIFARYKKDKKVFKFNGYVILPSWPQHQRWEIKDTIRKGIEAVLLAIPEKVRNYLIKIGYRYPIDTLSIPDTYRPCYSDTDTDTDSDSDPNPDTESIVLTTKKNPQVIHKLSTMEAEAKKREADQVNQVDDSIPGFD